MRSYEEITERVFARRDAYLKEQISKRARIRKISLSFAAFTLFAGAILFASFRSSTQNVSENPIISVPNPLPPLSEQTPEPRLKEPFSDADLAFLTEESKSETGSGWSIWRSPTGTDSGIDGKLIINYAGLDRFEEWLDTLPHYPAYRDGDAIRPEDMADLYRFAHKFNISKEDFRAVEQAHYALHLENHIEGEFYFQPEEQLDLIVGNDYPAYYEYYGNPAAVLTDTYICPPKWLYTHTSAEYLEKGITAEILEKRLPSIRAAISENVRGNYIGEYYDLGEYIKSRFFGALELRLRELRVLASFGIRTNEDDLGWLLVENKLYIQNTSIDANELTQGTLLGTASEFPGYYQTHAQLTGEIYTVQDNQELLLIHLNNDSYIALSEVLDQN